MYATLIGGGQEEIEWRGIAQPLVEGRYGVFIGGAVVGLFWVLWHLPLFLSSTLPFESINPIVFGFQTVGISVLLAWLYQRSGQSVLLTMMVHGWQNSIEWSRPDGLEHPTLGVEGGNDWGEKGQRARLRVVGAPPEWRPTRFRR